MPDKEKSPEVAVGEVSKILLRILAIEDPGPAFNYFNVAVKGGPVQIGKDSVPADALKNKDDWQLEEILSGDEPIKDTQYRFVKKTKK